MNRLMIKLFTFLFWLFCFPAYSVTLESLQQKLSQHEVIRTDFEQYRYIGGISKPLYSNGNMIISEKLGLWWQQKKPFLMTMKMNSNRIEQVIGNQKSQITAAKQPQLFQFYALINAIFNADKEVLEENFDYSLQQHDDTWTMTLIPKKMPLTKIFKQIQLQGEEYLNKITIDDLQNDKTELIFSNHQIQPLTDNEYSLFQ